MQIQHEDDLRWVREELDLLSFARTTWGLRPLEAMRYQELCQIERQMIRGESAA